MHKKLKPYGEYTDMRDAFFEELFHIAKKDRDVILLMADQGAFTFKKFYQKIPKQIINVGIAEQNMISVAAGLALGGKKVFVHAIATFATLRGYEQIKVDLSIMNLPVIIAGVGAGYTYGADGPTHHSNQDIAALRAIPNMRILNATDTLNLSIFPHLAYHKPQLTYIRFDKDNYPKIYNKHHNFYDGMALVKKGQEVCMISTGISVHQANDIANQLDKKFKIQVAVLDIYQLKPLNEQKLKKIISKFTTIITLEEHLAYGGLGTIVSDFLADYNLHLEFKRFGLSDSHCFIYGDRDYISQKMGLGDNDLIHKIVKFLKK